jgi:hypothetical protein
MIAPGEAGDFAGRFGFAFRHFGMAAAEPIAVSRCLAVVGYVEGRTGNRNRRSCSKTIGMLRDIDVHSAVYRRRPIIAVTTSIMTGVATGVSIGVTVAV